MHKEERESVLRLGLETSMDIQHVIVGGIGTTREIGMMLQVWPNATIHAVDPMLPYLEDARLFYNSFDTDLNAKPIIDRIKWYHNALWFESGVELKLYIPTRKSDRVGTTLLFRNNQQDRVGKAASITIDDICNDKGDVVIWLDIEGAELHALQGAEKTLNRTQAVHVEARDWPWEDATKRNEVDELLIFYGLHLKKIYNKESGNCDAIYGRFE